MGYAHANRVGRRVALALAVALVLVVSACSGSDDSSSPTTTTAGGGGGAADTVTPVRFQDVWVYEQISVVATDGSLQPLSATLLEHADGLGEPVELAAGSTFAEWPDLAARLVDGDGTTRADVEVTAGVVRSADDAAAVMVVATPEADDTPPIDHDDEVRLDLTFLDDTLAADDPLVYEYTFAHSYGPDEADAPDTGVALLGHRAAQGRLRYAGTPGGDALALVTDVGQVYEGSLLAGLAAKAGPMLERSDIGVTDCVATDEVPCVGQFLAGFDQSERVSLRDVGRQLCVEDCAPIVAGTGTAPPGGTGGSDGPGDPDDPGDPGGPDGSGDPGGTGGPDAPGEPDCPGAPGDPGDPDGPDGPPGLCAVMDCSPPSEPGEPGPDQTPRPPIPPAGPWGDPHVTTFDRAHYDMQSVGEFTLARSDDWISQVRFVAYTPSVSVVGMVATQMGEGAVVLDPGNGDDAGEPRILIDGEDVTPTANGPATEHDGYHLLNWGGKLQVGKEGYGIVELTTDNSPNAAVMFFDPSRTWEGLLGDNDGDDTNDLRLGPDGDVLTDPTDDQIHGAFADAWRITDDESLLAYDDGEATADYTDRDHPQVSAQAALDESDSRARAATLCAAVGLEAGEGLEECVLDYALTGEVAMVRGAARVALATAGWQHFFTDGANASSPAVSVFEGLKPSASKLPGVADDDTAYVFAEDTESDGQVLLAVDGATAQERWRLEGPTTACGVAFIGDDRIAVIGDEDGPLASGEEDPVATFVIVDRATGEVVTSVPFDKAPSTYCEPLMAAGDTVVAVDGLGRMYGWNVSGDTPTLEWTNEIDGTIPSPGVVTDAGLVVAVRNQPANNTTVSLIDPGDGAVTSQVDLDGSTNEAPLLTDGEVVMVPSGPVKGTETSVGAVTAIEIVDGALRLRWEHAFATDAEDPDHVSDREPSSPALAGDRYVVHLGNTVVAFDTGEGSVVWRQELRDFRNSEAPPVIVDDEVYDTSFGGPTLVVLSLTDGEFVDEVDASTVFARPEVPGREVIGPVIGDRMIVEGGDADGNLVIALYPVG